MVNVAICSRRALDVFIFVELRKLNVYRRASRSAFTQKMRLIAGQFIRSGCNDNIATAAAVAATQLIIAAIIHFNWKIYQRDAETWQYLTGHKTRAFLIRHIDGLRYATPISLQHFSCLCPECVSRCHLYISSRGTISVSMKYRIMDARQDSLPLEYLLFNDIDYNPNSSKMTK